jgi:hypothetical protein
MERGVTGKALFLCIVVAGAILVGAVVVFAGDLRRYDNVRDPTYQEALQFISSDQTDKNQYNQSYTCINFANDFVNNALNRGYRCGFVIIDFPESCHAIVCFNTSDKGLIFVEPQTDELVTLSTGQPYAGRTVLRFSITWPIVSGFLSTLVLSIIILQSFTMTTVLAATVYKRKNKT